MSVVDVQLVSRLPIQLLTVHQALLCFAEIELMQHSPASSNAHSAGCTVFGWLSRKTTLTVRVSQNGSQVLRYEPVRNWMVLNGSQHWDPPNRCFPHVCAPSFGAPPQHFCLLPQESYEPF